MALQYAVDSYDCDGEARTEYSFDPASENHHAILALCWTRSG